MRKTIKITLFFVLILVATQSSLKVLPVSGQISNDLLQDYLLEHPEFAYEYLVSNPSIILDYLSENSAIIYDYISSNLDIVSNYLLANPQITSEYPSEYPELVTQFISENPAIVSDYLSEHSELITQFISANPQIITEYISKHSNIVKDLVFSYATEHRREMLNIAFDFIRSQSMLLESLIGIVLVLLMTGFILGWLVTKRSRMVNNTKKMPK